MALVSPRVRSVRPRITRDLARDGGWGVGGVAIGAARLMRTHEASSPSRTPVASRLSTSSGSTACSSRVPRSPSRASWWSWSPRTVRRSQPLEPAADRQQEHGDDRGDQDHGAPAQPSAKSRGRGRDRDAVDDRDERGRGPHDNAVAIRGGDVVGAVAQDPVDPGDRKGDHAEDHSPRHHGATGVLDADVVDRLPEHGHHEGADGPDHDPQPGARGRAAEDARLRKTRSRRGRGCHHSRESSTTGRPTRGRGPGTGFGRCAVHTDVLGRHEQWPGQQGQRAPRRRRARGSRIATRCQRRSRMPSGNAASISRKPTVARASAVRPIGVEERETAGLPRCRRWSADEGLVSGPDPEP